MGQRDEQRADGRRRGDLVVRHVGLGLGQRVGRGRPLRGRRGGSLSLSYNTSKAISTLYSAEQQIGQSTGIGIATPGTFQSPTTYQYAWQPFIFGQSSPAGTIQNVSVGADVVASGALRTSFAANPLDPVAGQWWTSAYTVPDVALNHPARWLLDTQTGSPTSRPRRTAGGSRPRAPRWTASRSTPPIRPNVTASAFYWIKGMLITPAAANGTGPQLTQATAGDVLSLQVRVYNYSVADMAPDTVVHVQFYGQPVDSTTNEFTGPSVLVGEDLLAPIPGFSGSDDAGFANWALAGTTFDTSSYADTYLVFWVVVWMENASGLVAEMPGHGLTAVPPAGMTSITQVPIQPFSNNVGYYRQVLYVAAPGRSPSPTASAAKIAVQAVSVVPAQVDPLGKVKVRASILASGGTADGVTVFFYDGLPGAGGRLFDVETVPHIRQNAAYATQVLFRPPTCGTHTIVVVARAASGLPASGSATIAAGHCAVSALTGSATRVGDATDNAQVKISGRIASRRPRAARIWLNLASSSRACGREGRRG